MSIVWVLSSRNASSSSSSTGMNWLRPISYPRPFCPASTTSPVTESTSCCLSRLPVLLLICRKDTRSLDDNAGNIAIGQETSESLR